MTYTDPSVQKILQTIEDEEQKGLTEEEKEIYIYINETRTKQRFLGKTFWKKFPDKTLLESLKKKGGNYACIKK